MDQPSSSVPGRLRLRFTQLKQQTAQLDSMAAALHAIDGVQAVETNAPSGSLLINYAAASGKTTQFWDQVEAVLLAHQLLLDPRPLGRQRQDGPGHNGGRGEHPATPATRSATCIGTDSDLLPPARQHQRKAAPRRPLRQAAALCSFALLAAMLA
ncbi:HMA2 domain-containing protein [Massilia sp. TWP1-3-3]|uniref:HMA2 domain-containing protein n=1 Tax=Massilia sp. TWP1-3-3 TaxID=2804573 RepID=UPI003CEEC7F7